MPGLTDYIDPVLELEIMQTKKSIIFIIELGCLQNTNPCLLIVFRSTNYTPGQFRPAKAITKLITEEGCL